MKGPLELTFSDWLLAWDGYSVAAPVLNQMLFQSALMHKRVVSQIAKTAGTRDERLAVIYDVLVRCIMYSSCA